MSHIYNISRFYVFISKSVPCAAFLLLFTLALCGCGGGSHTTPINYTGDGTSGLRGVVTGYGTPIGATPQPIANATVSAHLNSTSSPGIGAKPGLGLLVAQTQADAQGNYSLPLIPGFYIIRAAATVPPTTPDGEGGEATVTTKQFVQLNLVINYGSP